MLFSAPFCVAIQEKWDSMTRKWRDYKSLVQQVQLFLIDEVHQLNDETRGPTMEAIVSRMKTIQSSMGREEGAGKTQLRFIAISATIPNIADVSLIFMLHRWCTHQVISPHGHVHYRKGGLKSFALKNAQFSSYKAF